MNIKRHIPNFLTCCNLLCGCLGLIAAFYATSFLALATASYLILIACLFDFFDGFVARLMKVTSPIGKELDSLADCITFGVLPGIIIFKLLEFSILGIPGYSPFWGLPIPNSIETVSTNFGYLNPNLKLIALLIPIFSAIRLAKFNIDTRQTESFIGVPTPANAILIAALPLILNSNTDSFGFPFHANYTTISSIIINPYFLVGLTILMSFLLIAELPLFALKFKSFKWADNQIRYPFLIASLLMLVFLFWTAIPFIIFLYVFLSFIENKTKKTQK